MHLSRRGTRVARLAVASLVCSLALAQTAPRTQVAAPSFASVAQAAARQNYTVVEQRRFRDAQGNVVSVRERLDVVANGTDLPDYRLSFLGVVGEPSKSPLDLEWQRTYQRYGRLFVDHGSFHIADVAEVQQNYTIHHFGTVIRAGRLALREVVFPAASDKSTWLIDVDAATNIPLYQVEYDSQFRMLAEVEAETFSPNPPAPVAMSASGVAPVAVTTSAAVTHPSFAAALTYLGNPTGMIEPGANLVPGYVMDRVFTRDDPLNGQQKLVVVYTDGVDQVMVVQTPNTADVFASLGTVKEGGAGNTIGRYRDPALSVLVFWDDDVLFHVAGRGAMQRLDDVAKRVYLQALSTH